MRHVLILFFFLPFSENGFAQTYVSESGYLKLDKVSLTESFLKKNCPDHVLTVEHDEKKWEVAEFRLIKKLGQKNYFFQSCKGVNLIKGALKAGFPQNQVAAFLFESSVDEKGLHLLWGETAEIFGAEWFESPKVLKSGDLYILKVPHPLGGNAGFNKDHYFILSETILRKLDAESFKAEIRSKIPKGLSLWNDIPFDLEKMTFETPLWQAQKDSHASPTGGRAFGTLKLTGDQIKLDIIQFENTPQ